ncbi:tRNA pseudouridine(55) synthase TruB [Aeoliella sp.]|uniref:tRNA pseudouridine(55) synthase TruB n=1 Tax=Aeoliella sp. TaxID=2795800 RepID=UPI003CCBE86B
MLGILNINKPAGWTSRDVVNRVQRLVRPAKVGHAGTLDPLATGVLVVCVGQATRLIEYVQRMPKRYVGTFQLGVTSPSDDTELETTPVTGAKVPPLEALQQAVPNFVGEIQQRPPAYSAAKLQGQRAYDLARRGEEVELAARPVTIYSIEIVRYEYPELVLDIRCGSGTYIRSLGRDLAESLGSGAVMSGLVRTAIGKFAIESSCTPEQVLEQGVEQFLEPATRAVAGLTTVVLTPNEIEAIGHGRSIQRPELDGEQVAALDGEGNLAALLVPRHGAWGPKLVFKG